MAQLIAGMSVTVLEPFSSDFPGVYEVESVYEAEADGHLITQCSLVGVEAHFSEAYLAQYQPTDIT